MFLIQKRTSEVQKSGRKHIVMARVVVVDVPVRVDIVRIAAVVGSTEPRIVVAGPEGGVYA